ncbi:serine/threonine-protein kinase [Pleionea mediterranea]|uniref:Serine/threonine-protein kinase n=1 Tax=Pleionea mediterranea TaxID=523701 RepID=A0A316FVN4_9GAMM|nr:serine/threonine-protein kinase [Pleionea mediterranea]PWK51736.1 serine/threonine-protein kinase [Pleionea mediterranea]
MTDHFKNIEAIFNQVIELPQDQQYEKIKLLANDDQEVISDVIELIKADKEQRIASVLSQSADGFDTEQDHWIGQTIDSYLIKKLIASGGMGSVYLGERNEGDFTHYVAIKFISNALNAKSQSRFQVERQILASLNHPNIGKLLDGGKTSNNVPYLIMEFITGSPIDAYCQSNQLTLHQRLELFIKVCRGVQFAHENLIIHRDIKASNVLIDHLGEPKVVDFGIAKILSADPSSANTQTQQRLLTPDYASPEQVTGKTQGFATDVYGLGVLLYKLLTDTYPLKVNTSSGSSIEQVICHETPKKASVALTSQSKQVNQSQQDNQASLPWSPKQLKGSLDNVLNKALQKNPEDRYASVMEFAEDIKRFLANRPVLAKPPSLIERSSKFIIRNKIPVATAAMFLLAISITVVIYTVKLTHQRDIAIEQKRISDQRADELESTTQFITSIFSTANPREKGKANTTAKDLLDTALITVDKKLPKPSVSKARLLFNIGLAYKGLQHSDLAIDAFTKSHQTYLDAEGYESVDALKALHRLGDSLRQKYENEKALELLSYTVKRWEEIYQGPHNDIADGLNNLAICLRNLGRIDEAIEKQKRSIAMHQSLSPNLPLHTYYNNLSLMYRDKREMLRANEIVDMALQEFYSKGDQSDVGGMISVLQNSGMFKSRMGLFDQAIAKFSEALERSEGLYGPDSIKVMILKREFAQALHGANQYEKANTVFSDVYATCQEHCKGKYMLAMIEKYYALLLSDRGEHEKAIQLIDKSIKYYIAQFSTKNKSTVSALLNQAEIYRASTKEDLFLAKMSELDAIINDNTEHPQIYRNIYRLIMAEYHVSKGNHQPVQTLVAGLPEFFIADFGDKNTNYLRTMKLVRQLSQAGT